MECTNCVSKGILCTGTPPQICPQCAVSLERGIRLDGPCVYGAPVVQPAQAGPGVGIAVASRDPRRASPVGESMAGNNFSNNNENLEDEPANATNENRRRRKEKADKRAARLATVIAMGKQSMLTNNEGGKGGGGGGKGGKKRSRKQKNRKFKLTRKQKL